MKKILLIGPLLIGPLLFISSLFAQSLKPPVRIIEDFSREPVGEFPEGFKTYPFHRGPAMRVYSVRSEGVNRFLKALDLEEISVQIFRKFEWEVHRWPNFSWGWRATTLPKGAAENNPKKNDSACGVYVLFGNYTGHVLKYVWSTTLPIGTAVEKKPGEFYMIVMESGSKNLGTWQTITINVVEDYKRLFKKAPEKNPEGFGILTDGNATHTPSACDYDNFKISEKRF